jgi:hypothetical protein
MKHVMMLLVVMLISIRTLSTASQSASKENHHHLLNEMSHDGLVIQTVIPKCGTSSMVKAMADMWEYIYAHHKERFPIIPYYAGKCRQVQYDKNEKCVGEIFGCPTQKQCDYHVAMIADHLSLSEIKKGYLKERGIDLNTLRINRVYYITIMRHPVNRVASEYHHWRRGWCCAWFFSNELQAAKKWENFTLSDFVRHKDCPANNRQTWMLADLPLYDTTGNENLSSGATKKKSSTDKFEVFTHPPLQPSYFHKYFRHHYDKVGKLNYSLQASVSYGELLNNDISMLQSAKLFVEKADAIGITEDLQTTVALFFASMFASSSSSRVIPIGSNNMKIDLSQDSDFLRLFKRRDGGSDCYDMFKKKDGKQISPAALKHSRHDESYEITREEELLIEKHNKNDMILYELAARIHYQQVEKYQLCRDREH